MKIFKNKFFLGMIFMSLLLCLIAAKPGGMTGLTSLWIGDQTKTADVTPGDNDAFIAGTLEVDGATRIDGAIDANSTLDVAGATSLAGGVTITGTGDITATNIADVTREIYFPMASWAVDSSNDIDDGSAPNLTTVDNIPAIVWDNSGETGGIQQTFRVPSTYVSGFTLYCLISSDTANGTTQGLDWSIWDNADGTDFDAAAIAQSTVTGSSTGLSGECAVLTLTLNASGEEAMVAGHFITVELFNATTHATANTELKGVTATFLATQ